MKAKILGQCKTAGLIESGVVHSSLAPDAWHQRCKGGHVDTRGSVTLCECPCHAGKPSCIRCGAGDSELDDSRSCIDVEGCVERYRDQIANNPRTEKYRRIQETASAERAAAASEAKRAIAAGERPPRRGSEPKPCAHCGEMTKGGTFVMGHDAKLKGILMRAGEDGDVASIVELKMRGWFPDNGRGADRYTKADTEAADRLVQANPTGPYLKAREEQRIALIADGADPEDAVRAIAGLEPRKK